MPKEKRWITPEKIDIPSTFQEGIGGHPLVSQTLYRRGYTKLEKARAFLDPDAYQPTGPRELPDIGTAIQLLQDAIKNQDQILVWGDFDVDGQTATTTLVEGLRELGSHVSYHIPVRGKESHGIKREMLDHFLSSGFDLLLTCDTGISEHENIDHVRNLGIPVIVTDHHSLGKSLPNANAVINPQRLAIDHPLRTLPGVGVAFKLMEGLFGALKQNFEADHYMELAALGIVADVAELRGDTRYLLQKGLTSLRSTRRIGLQTLYQNAGLNPLHINETHIGFQIAPRMNAVGRLGDANMMVEFLTTPDQPRARALANEIEGMNAKRRFDTRQVTRAAKIQLQNSPDERHSSAIVLHHPDWPGGIVGIVASKIVEDYHKPTILLTGEDPIHGSARSIEGINVTEVIATQSDHLISFGGHPMAAGLALPASKLSAFKKGFKSEVEKREISADLEPKFDIDQVLSLQEISLDFIEQVRRLAPFGAGNPPLHFLIPELALVSETSIGQYGEHRQVIVTDQNENTQKILWWNGGDEPLPEAQFDLICTLTQSDYKGTPQVTAEWVDAQLSEQGMQTVARRQIDILDLRGVQQPIETLHQFLNENPQASVWAEGVLPEGVQGVGRQALEPCETLVVWSTPPSQEVLQRVLQNTTPKKVAIFAINPKPDDQKIILQRLAGLAKYVVSHKGGTANLNHLASTCAVENDVVQVGLKYWEAKGKLNLQFSGDTIQIETVNKPPDPPLVKIYEEILHPLLEETQIYRQYFQTGTLGSFL